MADGPDKQPIGFAIPRLNNDPKPTTPAPIRKTQPEYWFALQHARCAYVASVPFLLALACIAEGHSMAKIVDNKPADRGFWGGLQDNFRGSFERNIRLARDSRGALMTPASAPAAPVPMPPQ